MNRIEKLNELRRLQARCDEIRQELEINPPGKITFWAALGNAVEHIVVIEADGFGGAITNIVEGNYPVDYVTQFGRFFLTEAEAVSTGEALAFQGASPTDLLIALAS